MDKTILVKPLIQEGKSLVQELDKTTLNLNSALWFYETEIKEWKLYLFIKELETTGPIKIYTKLQKILKTNRDIKLLTIKDIILLETSHPLMGIFGNAIHTGSKNISEIRFTNNVVNNFLIEDALIYRIS